MDQCANILVSSFGVLSRCAALPHRLVRSGYGPSEVISYLELDIHVRIILKLKVVDGVERSRLRGKTIEIRYATV